MEEAELRAAVFSLILILLCACNREVKPPSVAGSFYPSEPSILKETVDKFIGEPEKTPLNGELIAMISPHAGYQFSGSVAGYAYKNLPEDMKIVILIGPSHYYPLRGASVYKKGYFRTPLGDVRINEKIASSLINEEFNVRFEPLAFQKEHSLEVQIPFLQRRLKDFSIVPVLIGSPDERSIRHLISKFTEIMKNKKEIIIIASSDLSHYHPYDEAVKIDRRFLSAIEKLSIEELQNCLSTAQCEACGAWPVLIAMAVARNLGATEAVVYKYANSGDTYGDRSRVVGYAAIGFYRTGLTETQKKILLDIARKTIDSYVRYRKVPEFPITDKRLLVNGATFVTIKDRAGNLRGCIGNIYPHMPLYESVIRNAISASTADPRFPPMRPEELDGIQVEISVLSLFEPVKNPEEIVIGRDGLFIVKGSFSGLLLPQVPVEFRWDRWTFLKELCHKAGLPEDAWKDAELYRFTAEIIR